jgi:DedD protein
MAKQKGAPAGVQVDPADPVQQARTKARQRLIGAAVLLVIGIVAFPLVFETSPRPVPVDLPIDIPRRDAVPPLAMPASRPAPVAAAAPSAVEPGAAVVAQAPPPSPAVAAPSPQPSAQRGEGASSPRPALPPNGEARGEGAAEASRARAILEAREPAASAGGTPRFIVQVGAFADVAAARETRAKVEKLGLKTYTQVAETAQGSRIRVRVGPFATRDDADTALAKAKAAGIAAVVLTL